ncbi:histidine phosphatase family protein [Armatimonas rosea]|uniref:Broad specificity phosphatase PhoE n=1 Tax=Armatimonas rosea TaxID=685828 RepID=A0A7W9SP00_ARMRO|nr:histidine phosphatase family protein [Armatimonas rosea]MBB6050135.1 broad specificity phosphatase PhoE [Armatimonas rosea]
MPKLIYFITHPNVKIDPAVPVPQWPLSERGRERMEQGLRQPWVPTLTAIYSSTEQKAIDGAELLANLLGLGFTQLEALGENDRSATGFLPPDEFEQVANVFFAHPEQSVRGWETARAAQNRIVSAVEALVAADPTDGPIAIVSHGAVGTLLYCHLTGEPISRRWDQPPNAGGNYFAFTLEPRTAHFHWKAIDDFEEHLAALHEQGRQCAERGGQFEENPFLREGQDWQLLAWNRGFKERSIPNPSCSECHGTGVIILRSPEDPSPYDGAQIQCLCNNPERP